MKSRINLANFTPQELHQLQEIHERVQIEKQHEYRRRVEEENIRLRRLLLEAITCILHSRKPNDEFVRETNNILRLDKLK